jgi:hypothetical protein
MWEFHQLSLWVKNGKFFEILVCPRFPVSAIDQHKIDVSMPDSDESFSIN